MGPDKTDSRENGNLFLQPYIYMYPEKKLQIKDWTLEDQPQQKLITKGRSAVSDSELISIILGKGNDQETAVDIARNILSSAGNNLRRLQQMGLSELKNFRGVGKAKALSIIAAFELGRRGANITTIDDTDKICQSSDGYNIIRTELENLQHEEFWIMVLNRSNNVIHKQCISIGGMNATIVDPKILFKVCIQHNGTGIILAHNHPSGAMKPSEQDMRMTKRIKEAATIMDISLLDHMIIGQNTYFSFADDGLL